jgi:hypothetical protein
MPATAQAYGTAFSVGASGGSGTGAVSFTASGACSATGSTITMTSGTGSCSVFATKAADNNYSAITSATVSVSAKPAPPATVTITTWPTASSILYGQTLASSILSGGVASVAGGFAWTTRTIEPAVGTASYSVTFTPNDTVDYASVTGTVSATTISTDFVVTSGSGSATQTALPGGSARFGFTVSPIAGRFPYAVSFSVSGLPAGATATFSPNSIAAGSAATTVTLTVQTANSMAQNQPRSFSGKSVPLVLALLLLPFAGARKRARRWLALLLVLGSLAVTTALSGCGGSYFSQKARSYTATVTMTSNNVSHSSTIVLNVE